MKKILILMGRYLPGYKDGGPVRTIINVTNALGNEYDFRIVCTDRDHGDTEPYPNIQYDAWNVVGKTKVWYVKPGGCTAKLIRTLSKSMDLIYSCGFYDDYGYRALLLNRFGKLNGKPLVVASMGTFSTGALSHKSAKKKVFIRLCKSLGLFKNITWSVTSELEAEDLKREIADKAKYIIAEDLPRSNVNCRHSDYSSAGKLKLVFISRLSPQKNLLYAAEVLTHVSCDILFDIYGFMEDEMYWIECKKILDMLPKNVRYEYKGAVDSEEVPQVFAQYDAFLFPTMGENYGHVIFEALSAGCIPVISDCTPWTYLDDAEAGKVYALNEPNAFVQGLCEVADMSQQEKETYGMHCIFEAKKKEENAIKTTGYKQIFNIERN